jgi:ferrous iron transport protein A
MKNKKSKHYTLAELNVGERGIIDSFTNKEISVKLLEMGCLPGEIVQVNNIAPLGDPISISVGDSILGLRKAEAASVIIKQI